MGYWDILIQLITRTRYSKKKYNINQITNKNSWIQIILLNWKAYKKVESIGMRQRMHNDAAAKVLYFSK